MEGESLLSDSLEASSNTKALRVVECIRKDISGPQTSGPAVFHLNTFHRYSVDLSKYMPPTSQKDVVTKPLFDLSLQRKLEESGSLNWCGGLTTMHALKNVGHENSLLDAVSIFMWGVKDSKLVLRDALQNTAARGGREVHQNGETWDQGGGSGQPVSRDHSPETTSHLQTHLFLLANIIRRAIVVLGADGEVPTSGWGSKPSPVGIYLPLLWDSADCYPHPVVLGTLSQWQHFAPLVPVDYGLKHAVPLAWHSLGGVPKCLPVHFPHHGDQQRCLRAYLHLMDLQQDEHTVQAARLGAHNLPENLCLVYSYFKLAAQVHGQEPLDSKEAQASVREHHKRPLPPAFSSSITGDRCVMTPCSRRSSKFTWPFCHQCAELQLQGGGLAPRRLSWHMMGAAQPEQREYSSQGVVSCTALPPHQHLRPGPSSAPPNLHLCPSPPLPEEEWAGYENMPLHRLGAESSGDLLCGRCLMCKVETRTFNGLCSQCLQNTQSLTTGHTSMKVQAEPLSKPWGPSKWMGPAKGVEPEQRCRTMNCVYFGTVQHSGYCTLCYCCRQETRVLPPSSSSSLQISSTLRQLPRCSAPGCDMLGNPIFHGLCERCHLSQR